MIEPCGMVPAARVSIGRSMIGVNLGAAPGMARALLGRGLLGGDDGSDARGFLFLPAALGLDRGAQ